MISNDIITIETSIYGCEFNLMDIALENVKCLDFKIIKSKTKGYTQALTNIFVTDIKMVIQTKLSVLDEQF